MVSISTASKHFSMGKKEFLDFVKEKTWKEYSQKSSQISDAIFEELLKDYSKKTPDSTSKKTSSSKKSLPIEVASADEIFWADNSFLSELWFEDNMTDFLVTEEDFLVKSDIDEEVMDDDIVIFDDKAVLDKEKADKSSEYTPSNAVVIKSAKSENDKKTKEVSVTNETRWKHKPKMTNVTINTIANFKERDKSAETNNVVKWSNNNQNSNNDSSSEDSQQSQILTVVKKSDQSSKTWWSFSLKKKTLTKKDKKKWANIVKEEEPIKKREAPKSSSTLIKKDEITIWDSINIKEFSEKMWVSLQDVVKKLLSNKIILPVTASIDYDTALLIWEELWVKINKEQETVSVSDILSWNIQSIMDSDKDLPELLERPPIVTVMWHVDHGKTKLLDYLRKTDIVWWESWWITQSIWASQIHHNDKLVTFIDTPWHELFTSLRARGSKITDIAIIVVAADDWIKQQTVEAINHAKDAWVPIIVAITKIDLPTANIELVKSKLSEHWLISEDWWWDTVMVPISSITWEGITDLLDMVLLQSEMLELKYNPNRSWVWIVLESDKDAKKWITASIILMTWSMNVWDVLVIWDVYWKIRRMTNWKHKDITKTYWWDPVQILWIQELPKPWSIIEVVESEKVARIKIDMIKQWKVTSDANKWLQSILDQISSWEKVQLKLILKSDSFWSLEALKYAVSKLDVHENVEIKIIHSDVWAINDSDVTLSKASSAFILWFNVNASWSLKKKAENQWVILKSFDIIYELIDYVEWLATWMIKIEEKEVYIWKLDVKWVFYRRASDMIIGWKVIDWKILNNSYFRVFENDKAEEPYAAWKITSLKKEQENVDEISVGHECGMKIKVNKKIKEWDIIEFYIME